MLKGVGLIREYTSKYRNRITKGLAVYGEFDPDTDTRCLSYEAIEECLDVGSYLEMLEEKRPELTPHVNKARVKAIGLYAELKALEALERNP